jgi:hypothetical protein
VVVVLGQGGCWKGIFDCLLIRGILETKPALGRLYFGCFGVGLWDF